MNDVDFVILWVDGNDLEWQKEKSLYVPNSDTDSRKQRYRDWDNLQYWFRGVEKYAPWVRKIHFVTWGHLPVWLNTKHPKLHVVNHRDFMPLEYLPTFNCNPLEINLHRIEGLSEQFVYFNDDMFLLKKTVKEDFFKNGLPCDSAILHIHCYSEAVQFHFGYERAMGLINKYFDFHKSVAGNCRKWFCLKYGRKQLQSMVLLGCPRFPGLWQHHVASSYLKCTYKEIWSKEEEALIETTKHKFRHKLDFTQASMKAWQIAKGKFEPRAVNCSKSFMIQNNQNNVEEVAKAIRKQLYKMISINDGEMSEDSFIKNKRVVCKAFQTILPDKSSFEK